MVEREILRDDRIQDYIDGRLSERDRAGVAAYLLAHPGVAAEIEAIRRQSEALSAIGQEILDEPVPARLRAVLGERGPAAPRLARRSSRRFPGFLEAAAAIFVFCAGGALGWFAHDVVSGVPNVEDTLLADMTYAYDLYGARDYPVDFPPDRAEEFVTWIGRSFEREVRPPDLATFGYRYRGGRLIPTAGTRLGLFQFERPQKARLAVFFWITAAPPKVLPALHDQENIAAHFWDTNGLSFAVVSERANRDLETAAKAIFAFYEQAFDAS